MYKRILVAVDGSDTSNMALNEAIKLAKDQQAAIRIVHVADLIPTFTDLETPGQFAQYQEALRQIGEKTLSDAKAVAAKSALQAETVMHVIEAPGEHVYDAIAEEAVSWPADLIVIGTHGRRGIRRFLLGSVAEGLVRVATKPVLLVRGA
ncbi:universal stress protein [Bradyrhizobium sp.]|uniref:universal stress protein n=1 Tax=Bradyrhizobium sp. TaxID=376 RepID=UPI002399351C|nr:universal stress protein [Bradyrhizobium sp.]MDE1932918.1 universal stress protein [Bradyrhizobium sp.]MDE2064345.1 universal stress protein [Bradyrhizobium sp.]